MGHFMKQRVQYGNSTGPGRYKLPDDGKEHKVRPLPFDEQGRWQFPVMQHWAFNPKSDDQSQKAYICPTHQPSAHDPAEGETHLPTFQKECPFCARLDEMQAQLDNSESMEKLEIKILKAKMAKMRPVRSHLIQLKDCDDPRDIKRFAAPRTLYDEIFKAYCGMVMSKTETETMEELMNLPDGQIPDLFDWTAGHNLIIVKEHEGKSKKTVFKAAISGKVTPAFNDEETIKRMMAEVKDPLKIVRSEMVEQIETIDDACKLLEEELERKARRSGGVSDDDDDRPNLGSRQLEEDDGMPPPSRPGTKPPGAKPPGAKPPAPVAGKPPGPGAKPPGKSMAVAAEEEQPEPESTTEHHEEGPDGEGGEEETFVDPDEAEFIGQPAPGAKAPAAAIVHEEPETPPAPLPKPKSTATKPGAAKPQPPVAAAKAEETPAEKRARLQRELAALEENP